MDVHLVLHEICSLIPGVSIERYVCVSQSIVSGKGTPLCMVVEAFWAYKSPKFGKMVNDIDARSLQTP